MDDLANFDFAPAGMREREAALLERADVVFAGGRTLYENRRALRGESALRAERRRTRALRAPTPGRIRSRRCCAGPVFAYVGVIDERLDYDIVAALADAFPRGHVVLAGPVVKVDPARLPQRPNVHYTGRLAVRHAAVAAWRASTSR